MKKILITGVNSYVGNRFEEWVKQYSNDYYIDKVSLRDDSWMQLDLSVYDTILHAAGIVHRKETKQNEELYYKINRDLTYQLAKKAKKNGVKQFIFLSTMSVYGLEKGIISNNTPLKPDSNYAKSKLQGERLIKDLSDITFKIVIIRPPMIYGKGCRGNYQRLKKIALKTPVFPYVKNKRSMIYIDNLSEFIKKIIDESSQGLYCPQNKKYVNTSNLVMEIAKMHGHKIKLTNVFNRLINLLDISILNKVFGNLIYERNIEDSQENDSNGFIDFETSIKLTEK